MKYDGVFVGGPKDGVWYSSDKPEVIVAEMQATPVTRLEPTAIQGTVPYKEHLYRWFSLPIQQGTFGIFVHESMAFGQAIVRVVEQYRPILKEKA